MSCFIDFPRPHVCSDLRIILISGYLPDICQTAGGAGRVDLEADGSSIFNIERAMDRRCGKPIIDMAVENDLYGRINICDDTLIISKVTDRTCVKRRCSLSFQFCILRIAIL